MDLSRKKGATLRKQNKNAEATKLISLDNLFGKSFPGNLGSPIIDIGNSFSTGNDFFSDGNPIFEETNVAESLSEKPLRSTESQEKDRTRLLFFRRPRKSEFI